MDQSYLNRQILSAATNGDLEELKVLLSKGSYVKKNMTADPPVRLNLILSNGINVSRDDVDGHEDQTPLFKAASHGHKDCLSYLIKQGFGVDEKDRWGQTALHDAVVNDKRDCMEILIRHGADVNSKDANGSSPLHKAATFGRMNCLFYLHQHGGDLGIINHRGQSVLDIAKKGEWNNLVGFIEEYLQSKAEQEALGKVIGGDLAAEVDDLNI